MPETRETACCDIHSPVVCEPDTVVTVPCCPNCPSCPTPETAQVPADLLDEFERELERVDDGRIPYEPTREDFAAALAAVLPVVRAAERTKVDAEIRAKAFEEIGAKLDEFAEASCCGGIRECADPDCAWNAGYISGLAAARVVVRGATPDQPIEQDNNKPDWRERARTRVGDRVDARMEELMAEPPMSADEFDEAMRRNKAEAEAYLNQQSHKTHGEQP